MIVLLGSESGQKMEILRGSLENLLTENFEIIPCPVDSGIAEQPLLAAITRQGAINRAMRAAEACDGAYDFSFGLEAGLELVDGLYSFVCVSAILRPGDVCSVGTSGLMPLPQMVSERVRAGEYLSGIIREYRNQEELNDAQKEAVEDFINRRRGFMEAISNAWGESQI